MALFRGGASTGAIHCASQTARRARVYTRSRSIQVWKEPGRRTYADQGEGRRSILRRDDVPWVVASAALTIPTAIFLYNSMPEERDHGLGPQRPLVQERGGDKREGSGAVEGRSSEEELDGSPEDPRNTSPAYSRDTKPSHLDKPFAVKPTKGPAVQSGAMSAKQQGISNTETGNTFYAAPGKSQKSEGEIETAKLKGTIAPDRPQV